MELFQRLGESIERRWLEINYDEERFPALAKEELEKADIPSKLSSWEVIDWTLVQYELPRQRDVYAKFADPPITIFSGLRFEVDVYFWFEGTTAIHEHSFCGAFQVMEGSSIHSWYEFEPHESINTFLQIGEMRLKTCELLNKSDAHEIRAGSQYIHGLFHLEHPSATIVVRTDRSPLNQPQLSYHKPGFAIDPFFEQDTSIKKLQAMATLFRASRPETDELVTRMLASSDLQSSYWILMSLRHLLKANPLSELFKLESPAVRFEKFLNIVTKRHGKAAKMLPLVFAHQDTLEEIMTRRSYVTDPEQRFFMALLLNVDGREQIFSLIKQRFPDADPIEKVLDWTFDLSQTRVVGVEVSNALGIPDFGDDEMTVLEGILSGRADEEISSEAGKDLTEATSRVRKSAVFRPLL